MGSLHVPIAIGSLAGGSLAPLNALVDTGATYTSVPRERLEELGVQPTEQWPFILADGREVAYDIAWVRILIAGRAQPTIAVFADPGSAPLLGVVTLEEFRLALDPVNRRLMPVPALLRVLAAAEASISALPLGTCFTTSSSPSLTSSSASRCRGGSG